MVSFCSYIIGVNNNQKTILYLSKQYITFKTMINNTLKQYCTPKTMLTNFKTILYSQTITNNTSTNQSQNIALNKRLFGDENQNIYESQINIYFRK
jgi:hypothetical protein